MNILSRKDARNAQLYRFFTGKPCKNGHLTYRYTQSGTCAGCTRAAQIRVGFPTAIFRGPEADLEILRQIWRGMGHVVDSPTLAPPISGHRLPLVLPPLLQQSADESALIAERARIAERDAEANRQLSESIAGIHAKLAADAQGGDGSAPPDEFGPAWCK